MRHYCPELPYFSAIESIPKGFFGVLAYAIAEGHENRRSSKALLCEPIIGPRVIGLTCHSRAVAFGLCLWPLPLAFAFAFALAAACCLLPCRWVLLLPEL
jgi:hypothetical protein